jgi:hypothetical protein
VRTGPDAARGIINDGRLKTQFETDTSYGLLSPKERAEAEDWGLGIPRDVDSKERPVYGYVEQRPDDASPYGAVKFHLKDEVKDRTTMTWGDSLGDMIQGTLAGTPVRSPGTEGLPVGVVKYSVEAGDDVIILREFNFVEAQIQGGVTLKDVEYVDMTWQSAGEGHVHNYGNLRTAYKPVVDAAKAAGIPVRYTDPDGKEVK